LIALVIGIVVLLIGVIVLIKKSKIAKGADVGAGVVTSIGVVFALIGLAVIVFDSFTIVPARNVGIVVAYGKPERTLDNGFHWVKPWASIETVDATVQNINLSNDAHNCITVRLANQTTACVDVTVQWNVDQHTNANELWQRYRGNNDDVVGNIQRNVVERELRRSLNVVFAPYNPLSVLSGQAPNESTDDLASKALGEVKAHVDQGIVVDTLRISVVHFDDTTQAKLNGYAQALADTQIATQQKLTAAQQKQANYLLAAASSNDAGVKYQNCLNLLKDLAAKGQLQNLPQTFNCSESTTPVIVSK